MSRDTISILDGSTFMVSDRRGDIDAGPDQPHGLFFRDTRFLSRWILSVDGRPLDVLSTDDISCRQLLVSNGRVSGATGPCPHANGTFNPANGTTPVQLAPFSDTPNKGGQYKV